MGSLPVFSLCFAQEHSPSVKFYSWDFLRYTGRQRAWDATGSWSVHKWQVHLSNKPYHVTFQTHRSIKFFSLELKLVFDPTKQCYMLYIFCKSLIFHIWSRFDDFNGMKMTHFSFFRKRFLVTKVRLAFMVLEFSGLPPPFLSCTTRGLSPSSSRYELCEAQVWSYSTCQAAKNFIPHLPYCMLHKST